MSDWNSIPCRMSDFDEHLFGRGIHYEIYKKLGAHPGEMLGQCGTFFSLWAPHAEKVSVAGDFNDWDPEKNYLKKTREMGIFEQFVPGARPGQQYLFCITAKDGRVFWKADPYAFSAQLRPGTNSVIADNRPFPWTDGEWLNYRRAADTTRQPLSIYEVHPGSWRRQFNRTEADPGFFNYRQLAEELCVYVRRMGFSHVELMGIAEHPLDASWGYQVTSYYAPTSRYGSPEDFKYLVNRLHEAGIGVILDWVPAHFPRDAKGLALLDGEAVYENADPRRGDQPDWGTKIFDYGKPQVSNFLIANALYWAEVFHIDGLRVDAVASMLYLDYGRKAGEWLPNEDGGNENREAVEFFRHLNSIMKQRNPGVLMIAEESTAWPRITCAPEDGGLGFTYKWNMGWMHDFLEYLGKDPLFRKGVHNLMTFSLTYAWSEHYVLPLSHDEVVHLKKAMLEKMPGTEEEKFACLKCAYGFMYGHPGKKLLFMGDEFGQKREWSEDRGLDFHLCEVTTSDIHADLEEYYPGKYDNPHEDLRSFVAALNRIYREYGALHASDDDSRGFYWINADDSYRSIFSFVRRNRRTGQCLLFVVNFTPVARPDYCVGVPKKGKYRLLLSSCLKGTEEEGFLTGKPGEDSTGELFFSEESSCDNQPCRLALPLPPYGFAVLKFNERNYRR